jgi:tetratricopeptide (TPR) repeat protein
MLGEGGMGAVYKAYDKELDRTVALKLVRPGLADNPMAVQRFKQELLLASKISHKNVLRIHDLGEFGGTRFISMAFIEGEDLHQLLMTLGKLPLERTLNLARQLCAGLDAAHSEGVVHRDFKPQNILLDKEDHAYISDFGLSKSFGTDATGMTRSGEMLGTPRYMAPEQVEGGHIDNRADIYALGLILYEMVTGDIPFQAETTVQLIYKHVHEQPRNPREQNSEVPDWLARVIMKCIEKDPESRYASAAEVLEAISTATAPPPSKARKRPTTQTRGTLATQPAGIWAYWKYAAVAMVLVAAIIGALVWRWRAAPAHSSNKPVTVLVADFTNHTGDPVFDGTLEPMFNVALEGASFINGFNRGTARKLAQKLPNPTDKLDEQPARLVALSKGVSAVITGEISRRGDNYNVSAVALDTASGNVIAKAEVTAADKDKVLGAIPKLAAPIRNALGDTTPESAQLERAGGAFTAASLEVVHQYGTAMEQQFAGKVQEALKSFAKSAELDPSFARAYSGMTSAAIKLDRLQDAEKYMKLAMAHVDRMTDRERYRVRGLYYGTVGDYRKCAEEYTELVKTYPGDNIGHNNLAVCLSQLRNWTKAVEEARQDLAANPNATAHANLAVFLSYAGDFQGGESEARQAQKLYPSYEYSHLGLAFAKLGQGQLSQASEAYRQLEKVSARGASMAASGLGDLAIYEGRFADAVGILEGGAATEVAAKNADAAADKFGALAYAQLLQGQRRAAIVATEKALANSQSVKIRFLAARTFLEAGETARAQKLAAGLASELQVDPQSYAKIIEGDFALKRQDPRQAIKALTEAKNQLDTWIAHFDLGRAYLQAGAYVEADAEFDACLRRRGETLALFLDEAPTYGYFPALYYYQGQARQGLKSPGYADAYRTYLTIREKAGEDPLVAEIRRRLGQ